MMTETKMKINEIRHQLSEAFHEVGHANEQVGRRNYLAAYFAAGRAKEALSAAHAALEKIQD